MTRTVPRILATSGGFRMTERWGVVEPAGLLRAALQLTGKARPRLALVPTATGDDRTTLARLYGAFRGWSVDVSHLELFAMPNADPRTLLMEQDVIWVGGGSVANLLAVWRTHGLDAIMREAWEAGIVLSGVSAGSICWHLGGPTDSRPVGDVACRAHLERPEHRHVDVAAPDHREARGAVEVGRARHGRDRLLGGVDHVRVELVRARTRADAEEAVLGM